MSDNNTNGNNKNNNVSGNNADGNRYTSGNLYDYNWVKPRLFVKMMHESQVPAHVPYISQKDMACTVTVYLDDFAEGNRTECMYVTERLAEKWGYSINELFETAQKNTPVLLPYQLINIREMVNDIFYPFENSDDIQMWILTSKDLLYGSSYLFCKEVLVECAEKFRTEALCILPSSIHELILVPVECGIDPQAVRKVVREVNRTLLPKELLSEYVFLYRPSTKTLYAY